MVYMVTYDLRKPGRSYDSLYRALKAYTGPHKGIHESAWLINTDESATQVHDKLRQHIDGSDSLAVFEISNRQWALINVDPSVTAWVKQTL